MEQKIVPPNFTHVGRFWGHSKAVGDIQPVAKLVATEPMLKTVLGALDGVHEAVKKLVKLPRVLYNVGKVFCAELHAVKMALIPLSDFRQQMYGFNKPVELREVRADQIMRVFQKTDIGGDEKAIYITDDEYKQAIKAEHDDFANLPDDEKIAKLSKQGVSMDNIMRHLFGEFDDYCKEMEGQY
jgi:hypothetical protein